MSKKSTKAVAKKSVAKKVSTKATKKPNLLHEKLVKPFCRPNGATLTDTKEAGFECPAMAALKIAERRELKTSVVKKKGELTRFGARDEDRSNHSVQTTGDHYSTTAGGRGRNFSGCRTGRGQRGLCRPHGGDRENSGSNSENCGTALNVLSERVRLGPGSFAGFFFVEIFTNR